VAAGGYSGGLVIPAGRSMAIWRQGVMISGVSGKNATIDRSPIAARSCRNRDRFVSPGPARISVEPPASFSTKPPAPTAERVQTHRSALRSRLRPARLLVLGLSGVGDASRFLTDRGETPRSRAKIGRVMANVLHRLATVRGVGKGDGEPPRGTPGSCQTNDRDHFRPVRAAS
jgi:hypothetical protein